MTTCTLYTTQGWSLLMWSRKTKFCTVCGTKLVRAVSGSGAKCPGCGHVTYPTTSPVSCDAHCDNCDIIICVQVGIVSIGHEASDQLLLIRQPRYPPGMYSCIAGFLDSGETLEVGHVVLYELYIYDDCQECVRREVAEEVGLDIDSVAYKCSQHWPFPAGSLMVGCHATVTGDLPTPDPCKQELEDARWFSRDEVIIYIYLQQIFLP